jgi:transposase
MDGKSCPEIAQWLYRDEEAVRGWGHAFNAAGLRGLERAPVPGWPTWLTTEQLAQLKEAVRHCPRAVGYHMRLRATKLVRHFISTRFGMEVCRERARQLPHALGFRLASSPELNPQERLWKWLRRVVTHHHWCASLLEGVHAIRDFLCYLAGCKAQVRHLCAVKTPKSFVASL